MKNKLSAIEYNNICKYWRIFEKLNDKLTNFNKRYKYKNYSNEYDSDDEISASIEYNNKIRNNYSILENKLKYFEKEYVNYINKIGLKLNDPSQDEYLFNLLNNGIILK